MVACRFLLLSALLLVPFSSVAARDDDSNTVEVAILDVLLERGIIDAATYDELMALAQAESQRAHEMDLLESRMKRMKAPEIKVSGGKPGKFLLESEDGKWSMGFKGRLQVQVDVTDGESGNREADETNYSVRRGRLALFGKAGGENMTYKVEVDVPTQNTANRDKKDFSLTDAWLNWKIGETTNVKAGQHKVPFGREVQFASSKLDTVSVSLATKEFAPDREPGLSVYGSTPDKFVQWWAMSSNGEGTGNSNKSGKTGSGASGLRSAARLVFNPLGELKGNAAAFQTVDDGGVKVAFGASVMHNADQAQDVDGDGTAGDGRSNDTSVGLEFQLLAGPVSFLTESFRRSADVSGGSDIDDDGYNAQVGVFVVPKEIELVARRSEVDYDVDADRTETTFGAVFYRDGHNSKFSLEASNLHVEGPANDEMIYRGQYQIIF
jgi:hypothetical protein